MLDELAPYIALTIFVLAVIWSQFTKANPPQPQELAADQRSALHSQTKVWVFVGLMFLLVAAVDFLLFIIMPEKAPEMVMQLLYILCLPTFIIALMIVSVSTIKYKITSNRGRGQRDYPTGGLAVFWGILGLMAAFGLVFIFYFFAQR
jgi:hypothetical protein